MTRFGRASPEIVQVLKPRGRLGSGPSRTISEMPNALNANEGACCFRISGAVGRGDYLVEMAAAGLTRLRVVSEAAAPELLASDCCGGGLTNADLEDAVIGLSVAARKVG